MQQRTSLALAGFLATGVTYGPGRMGFGLFLPQFRDDFGLSTSWAGALSSLGFLGFLVALLLAHAMTARIGPRLPVLTGCTVAAAGMALVAVAPNGAILAAGVVLALSSAGFAWAPFNNAAHRTVDEEWRPDTLSVISTGTTVGVAAAGVLALVLAIGAFHWRIAWGGFAVAGVVATLAGYWALRALAGDPGPADRGDPRTLRARSAIPLYVAGFVHGLASAVFISLAADRVVEAGGMGGLPAGSAPAIIFIAFGICGLTGLWTNEIRRKLGLARLLQVVLGMAGLSLALIAVAGSVWPAVVIAAGLQGAFVMMMSAILSFWSDRLFPSLPSGSFTAALLAFAAGSVAGPAIAGYVSDALSPEIAFGGIAAVAFAAALAARPGYITEYSAQPVPV